MALTALAAMPSAAQTPAANAGPQAVLSQTVRGVTVQLKRVSWDGIGSGSNFFAKAFTVSYVVQASPTIPLPPGKRLTDYITNIAAFDPSGFPLSPSGSTSGGGPSSIRWDDVDPRWPVVALDVEFLDPAAPPRATGRSVGPITITNIPVPSRMNVETPVHAEMTTPLGTRVIVEKVEVSPNAKENNTTFTLHVLPDPEATDLNIVYSTGTKVVDDTGVKFNLDANTGGLGSGFSTLGVRGVPSPGAKTMSLTLDATELSDALKQDSWYRHFHLLVPLRPVSIGGRRRYSSLATAQGQDVIATLDSIGWQDNRYQTRVVMQDRSDPTITWRLRAVRGKDDAGNQLLSRTGAGGFYWKIDGSPLAPDENSGEVYVGAPGNPSDSWGVKEAPPGAKTLSFTADVEAVREQDHFLDIPQIPIPALGQTLTPNRRVQDAQGADLVLRKISAYSPDHPLPAGFDYPYRSFVAPPASSGLAVVLAEPPSPKGKREFDFSMVTADDPTGLRRRPVHSLDSAPGDALLGAAPPPTNDPARVTTFYLLTPSPGAQTFNLRLYRDETIPLNKRETLTFPDIPAPVPPKNP